MVKDIFIFSLKEDLEAKEEKLARLIEKSMRKPKIRLSIPNLQTIMLVTMALQAAQATRRACWRGSTRAA